MSTPSFVPQDVASLQPVRYYTPFDPYFYTVDNRPLQDLAANIQQATEFGGDSARRSGLITQLGLSAVMQSLFDTSNVNGIVDGMALSLSGTVLTVGFGAWYVKDTVNTDISTSIVKQALHATPQTFQLVRPTNSGYSTDYLIQARYSTLTSTTMPTSGIPFLDATNNLLPGILLNGEVKISLKSGSPGVTGGQITPAPDSGHIPLYVITVPSGSGAIVAQVAEDGPSGLGASQGTQYVASNVLAEGVSNSIDVPLSLLGGGFNPLVPIKIRVLYTSTAASGHIAIRADYITSKTGSALPTVFTSSAIDQVPVPTTSGMLSKFTTINAVVPTSAFAAFSATGKWGMSKDFLRLRLTRRGTDALDTAAGSMTVHEVIAFQ